MKGLSLWAKVYFAAVAFSLAGLLITKLTNVEPGFIQPISAAVVVVTGFLTLTRETTLPRVLAVLIVGALAEIVGLYFQFPFGDYEYTRAWQPTVQLPGNHNFPLCLPFAWFLIAGGTAIALRPLGRQALVLAPIISTLIDFFMEPVMTRTLHYWEWQNPGPLPGGAPWLNVFGWLLTSFLATLIIGFRPAKRGTIAPLVLAAYVLLLGVIWLLR